MPFNGLTKEVKGIVIIIAINQFLRFLPLDQFFRRIVVRNIPFF